MSYPPVLGIQPMRLIQELRPGTKIAVVGEAPGAKEDASGIPFSGASGELLNELSARSSIYRNQCSITNVTHTRPPKNDFGWFLRPKPRPEYILGVMQLKADLEALRPNVVVAMGAHALRALTNHVGIDKWRGSILASTLVPGLKVIGSYHPAFIFRDHYDYKYLIERDLARVAEEAKSPDLVLPQRDIIVDPPADQRDSLAGEMLQASWLAIDIEANEGPQMWMPSCICFADRADRIMVLPWTTAHMPTITMLLSSPVPKVFQNGVGFDMPVLTYHGVEVTNFAWDTMLGMHALYAECSSSLEETLVALGKKKPTQPAIRKGLAFQTSWFTREPYYKDDGKTWSLKGDINILYKYNGRDGGVTREIRDRQAEDLADFGTTATFEHEMSMVPSCMAMSRRGFLIDKPERTRMLKKYKEEVGRLQAVLDGIAERSINVKSPDVKWLLFEKLGMPIKKRSKKTDAPTADKYVIADLAQRFPHPALQAVIEIRERRDMIERYLDVPLGLDGRMRCTWDITGTRTGRLASRTYVDGTGTNMQNQPPRLRSMFVADPGMVLISVDYSQAEARVVAWLAECLSLIELFLDPSRDVHTENASRFYNIPADRVTFAQRYTAKRIIHASNYGMAPARFVEVVNADYKDTGIRINLADATISQQRYFMLYPEIKSIWWQECRDQIRADRTISNVYGRKRMFLGRWSERFLNEVYAQGPQSTIGDMTGRAQVRVYDQLDLPDKAQLLINGHDSLVVQAPIDYAEPIAMAMEKIMSETITIKGRDLTVPTDVEVGLNWAKRKVSKDGKVINPNGLRPLDEWLATA